MSSVFPALLAAGTFTLASLLQAQQPRQPTPAPAELPTLELQLVRPGSAPLRMLRYAWDGKRIPPATWMSVKLRTEIRTDGATVRQQTLGDYALCLAARASASPGTPLVLELVDGRFTGPTGMKPEDVSASEARIKACMGTRVLCPVHPRGLPVALTCQPSEHALRVIVDPMRDLLEQFRILVTPLPEEPVGAGAEWQVSVPLKQNGQVTLFKVRYRLVELEGDRITVNASMDLPLDPKAFPVPVPSEDGMQLKRMSLLFNADMKQDLGLPVPVRSTFSIHLNLDMSAEHQGKAHRVEIRSGMDLDWAPAEPRTGR